jgi:acyl-CoA synthetase (AMP-forming)/AMP-acid ligase II
MSALYQAILARAAAYPDRIALDDGAGAIRYGEIEGLVESAASVIRQTLDGASGPVAIDMDNGVNWVLADLTLLAMGLPCVPLPPYFSASRYEAAQRDIGAVALITARGIRRRKGTPAAIPPGTAKISYASAGPLRGSYLTEAEMLATAADTADRFGIEMAGVHLPVLPLPVLLENVAGLYATLLAGGTYVALTARAIGLTSPARPNYDALMSAIVDAQAASLILAPDQLEGLVTSMETRRLRLPTLRLVAIGGGAVPMQLLERATAVGLPAVLSYGLAASGAVLSLDAATGVATGGTTDEIATLAANGEVTLGSIRPRGKQEVTTSRRRASPRRPLQAATSVR